MRLLERVQLKYQIEQFSTDDTLYLTDSECVYADSNTTTYCHQIQEPHVSSALIPWKGPGIDVETIQSEMMGCLEQAPSFLYTSLLDICETFLNSVNQAAWLTAIPIFASEVLYRSGGYTHAEVEKFAQEIQTLLLTSFANSPHAMTASLLARCLASRLTHSSRVISTLAVGAGIVTGMMTTVLTTNASFGWIALQTGVALMGSVAGSLGIQKLPQIGHWGFNQATRVTGYLGNSFSFWSSSAESSSMIPTDRTHLSSTKMFCQ